MKFTIEFITAECTTLHTEWNVEYKNMTEALLGATVVLQRLRGNAHVIEVVVYEDSKDDKTADNF